MEKMATRLAAEGFAVTNLGYPSRTRTIEEIADDDLARAVETCRRRGARRIDFVTHSMGGIVVRYYLKHHAFPELGRVVMLAPPNAGSEVVDKLKGWFVFKWWNGPAGQELGTGPESLPLRLGPVAFACGIIAGDRSINPILSMLIPGPDDGKVAVRRTRVQGMRDFLVIHAVHPFIMKNKAAIDQTVAYLKTGKFRRLTPGAV